MKKRLFLTGPIGCGKSTAIRRAVGEKMSQCGGFLTRRYFEPYLHFALEDPCGQWGHIFLDFSTGKPEVDLSVFANVDLSGPVLILDEIGGIELLNPDFVTMLDEVLKADIPMIGVIKGEGPAGALIDALGLTEEYQRKAQQLRQQLADDPDTLVYHCRQFDETALHFAKQWVEAYLPH